MELKNKNEMLDLVVNLLNITLNGENCAIRIVFISKCLNFIIIQVKSS